MKLRHRKKTHLFSYCTLTIICTFLFIIIIDKKFTPLAIEITKNDTEQSINNYIFNTFSSEIINDNIDNLIQIDKNNKDEIISVSYNIKEVYKYLGSSLKTLHDNVENLEFTTKYYNKENKIFLIPSGILTKRVLFTNFGTQIPCKIYLFTDIKMGLRTIVKSYGMNNSLLEIYLNIQTKNSFLGPVLEEEFSKENSVLLASKFIVGTIPAYYGGIISQDSAIVTSEK